MTVCPFSLSISSLLRWSPDSNNCYILKIPNPAFPIHPTPHSFDKTPFALVQSAFLSYLPVFVPLLSVSCRIVYWIGTETCMLCMYQEGDKLTHTQVTEPRYWQKGRKFNRMLLAYGFLTPCPNIIRKLPTASHHWTERTGTPVSRYTVAPV